MPTYDYDCPECGRFDAQRRIAARDEPASCPQCTKPALRVVACAPRLALMASAARGAFQINERAAHAPQHSSSYQRLAHPAGCGCCATTGAKGRGATVQAANGAKVFPSKRPWMISH